jgi:hypothetical protein
MHVDIYISTREIVDVLKRAPSLLWVDLSWVNSMDTASMELLVKSCPKLIAIDYYCERIEGKLSKYFSEARGDV